MAETSLCWIPKHVAFEVFAHICDKYQNPRVLTHILYVLLTVNLYHVRDFVTK